MKKIALAFLAILALASFTPLAFAVKPTYGTITGGDILYSAGHYLAATPIPTGFDPYGYNYQGHMFCGSYFNVYSGGAGFPPYEGDDVTYLAANPTAASHWAWSYRTTKLIMKWNDAWLSNKDVYDEDGITMVPDGKLDRHPGFPSYIGSGAWETNHQYDEYEDAGVVYKWNYFCKIVAVPEDATLSDGIWYAANGVEIGPSIWGQFAIIQEVYNDQGSGDHGLYYVSPYKAGFGAYMP